MAKKKTWKTNEVYGVSNDLIKTYIERKEVDEAFTNGLQKNKHIIIYGASKQGKTSLTNKHLDEADYVKVNCSPVATTLDIYNAIVRQLNLEILDSVAINSNVGGEMKVGVKAKIKVPWFGGVDSSADVTRNNENGKEKSYKLIDYNLALAQDVSELLRAIKFNKRIILENFHYLTEDVQQQLAIDLRIFEDYNILFIILGIWREKNRLAQFNGDLVDRLIEVPVEPWSTKDLKKIIEVGKIALNVSFDDVVDNIIDSCFDSVGVFQEICKEACYAAGFDQTQSELRTIRLENVEDAIAKKMVDYSARHVRCLETFIEQRGRNATEIPLYIPYYFVKILFNENIDSIVQGLKRKMLQDKIKETHHRPDDVRPSDMGYFLQNLVRSQVGKGITPPVFDFDNSTKSVKIIDSTFYFFIKNCNREEIFETFSVPPGLS